MGILPFFSGIGSRELGTNDLKSALYQRLDLFFFLFLKLLPFLLDPSTVCFLSFS